MIMPFSRATMNADRTTGRYFQLLAALGQAVIATDAAGLITRWSPAAETLYGWRADEVIGRDILEVTPIDISRAQGQEIMQALARGELWSGEFQVKTRQGDSFIASVTDIPLRDEAQRVVGVVGVSAVSSAPTELRPLLSRFAAACDQTWPTLIRFNIDVPAKVSLSATEPHMIQLLAVLILLYGNALDGGSGVEVTAGAAEKSLFTDFGLASASSAMYIRIDRRNAHATYSVLRSLPHSAEPTKYAAALVRMVGGMLIAGTASGGLNAMHLFLPLELPQ